MLELFIKLVIRGSTDGGYVDKILDRTKYFTITYKDGNEKSYNKCDIESMEIRVREYP